MHKRGMKWGFGRQLEMDEMLSKIKLVFKLAQRTG